MSRKGQQPGPYEPNGDSIWYVAQLGAGATRLARPNSDETVVEEALRDVGLDYYLPRMRKEIIHSRSRRTIIRTFPLFTGYIFVASPPHEPRFGDMLNARGIARILGNDSMPMSLSASYIEAFRTAETDMRFDDTREARIRRRQEGRTHLDTIRMQFPIGKRTSIAHGPFAGFSGHVVDVVGKGLVKVMVEIFGRLTPIDTPVEYLRRVA